jgi:digalactosyldiacylglycerol synthase
MRSRERHFTIITTAALPWLTGTSVNPLLRALYLAKSGRSVVLAIPWLELEDQKMVFPGDQTFSCKEDQEKIVLDWCRNRAKIDPATIPIRFVWYAAAYVKSVRSVFPVGDPSEELNADDPRDVLILEEPEHLSWYHKGNRWTEIFPHVVGIVHTNYQDYLVNYADTAQMIQTSQFMPDSIKETAVFAASTLVCSAYCDVNIKLSDTIMPLPNEVTCNVHGVRQEFIAIGESMGKNHLVDTAKSLLGGGKPKSEVVPAYYLGKALYEKGWGELLDLLEEAGSRLEGLRIDGYGSGIDYEKIIERAAAFKEDQAHLSMNPGRDHADKAIHKYGVLINPSTSDVLCTVTVEALAMGKHVVLARHPSNRFFQEYFASRSHFFNPGDVESFIEAVQEAVAAGPPQPLPEEERRELTWEAANERLFTSAEVRVLSGPYQRPSDASTSRLAYRLHNDMMSDRSLSEFLKEATLGNSTPWDTSLKNWRSEQLDKLESEAGLGSASPATTQQWERKLRESALELEKSVKQTWKDIVR